MTKPSTITKWLMQPGKFSDSDRKEAAALIKTYPYFTPTRYIEAAEHHKKQPFAPAMLNMMHLYMGNWLLFHEFLQSATAAHGTVAVFPQNHEQEIDAYPDDITDQMEYPEEILEEDDVDLESFGGLDDETDASNQTVEQGIAEEILEEGPFFLSSETEDELDNKESLEADLSTIKEESLPEEKSAESYTKKTNEGVKDIIEELPPITKKDFKKEKPIEEIPFYQNRKADSLIQPIYTEDYFLHQGLHVSDEIPQEIDHQNRQEDKSLMVVMSFSEWLMHFKTKGERQKEEQQDQKALKTMWQKEKLAAALEEENEEIPETVFEMAVNSITKEEDLASEPLAEIMVKQGKYDKAIDMYRKLSLRNPQKKTYFARKIEELQKEKES